MRGGYKGYYNGHALDSSYEYIYCKILEAQDIEYEVHEHNYQLRDRQYIPDFFLYKNNELYKIVEIRGHRLNIEERIKDVKELKELIKIDVELITELDLRKLCKEYKISYNSLKTEWRKSPDTKINYNVGEFNAMYGRNQSDVSKRKSSEKGKERFYGENKDKYFELCTNKMVEFNRANNFEHMRKPRANRVELTCLYCGKVIPVTEAVASHQKYCSLKCSGADGVGLKQASAKIIENKKQKDLVIKDIVFRCAKEYKEDILSMKLNEIQTSTAISYMIDEVRKETDVFDMRTITQAVFGTKSRKEFIKLLKDNLK